MEEEAEKLKEMQGEVEKQMMTAKTGQCLGMWKGVWVETQYNYFGVSYRIFLGAFPPPPRK